MLSIITGLFVTIPAFGGINAPDLIEMTRAIEHRLLTTDVAPSVAFELSAELAGVQDKLARETRAVLTLTDEPAYNFGTLEAGQSAEHTFTLTNSGGQHALRLTGAAITAPFVFHGGYPGDGGTCGGDLPAGQSCTLVMHFEPTEGGFANDLLTLSYFYGAAEQTVTRTISGVGHVTPK